MTDGSKDKTNDIVRSLVSETPTLQLLDYEINRGKGYAVKQGMSKASGDLRLFTDADNSTSINHLETFLPYINEGFSVVIGSIAVAGHKVATGSEPAWRRIFGKFGNLFIQISPFP